ncbi:MAG: Gfo/Idh/MocA family oxidoreductase [Bacteroidota bacterium]
MSELRSALIGCGSIGRIHTECLSKLDGMKMVGFCDQFSAAAEKLAQEFGGEYHTNDVNRVLRDDSIDAIYICTHHDTHSTLAIRACESGKHIMIEKPLALSLEECHRVGEAVEKSGVKLMTAFKMRYYPMVRRAKEFIPRPLVTVAQMLDGRWPDDLWAQDSIKGGGNVLSQGCHTMDLVYFLNGSEPTRIYAEGGTMTHTNTSVIDNIVATIVFRNQSIASVTQGDGGQTPYVSKFSFQILDGMKSVHLHDRLKTGTFFDGEKTTTNSDNEEYGFLEENRDFIRALRENVPPPIDHRDGLRATLLILNAFEAIRTRQPKEIHF